MSGLNSINPPAIIATITRSRAELEQDAAALARDYEKYGRKLLDTGKALGETLCELRDTCKAGEWYPLLEKLKIPQRTATDLMVKFKTPKRENTGNTADTGQPVSEESPVSEELKDFFASEPPEAPTINWIDKECRETVWFTPPELLERVREYFGGPIPLDPATSKDNPTAAKRFFTEAQDGLRQSWAGKGVFVNPPYGEVTKLWCEKIHSSADVGTPIIALLPCGARFSTGYWQEHILTDRLSAICFHLGRVSFVDGNGEEQVGNPYDSAIYGYNADQSAFARAFCPLGKVFNLSEVKQ